MQKYDLAILKSPRNQKWRSFGGTYQNAFVRRLSVITNRSFYVKALKITLRINETFAVDMKLQ